MSGHMVPSPCLLKQIICISHHKAVQQYADRLVYLSKNETGTFLHKVVNQKRHTDRRGRA